MSFSRKRNRRLATIMGALVALVFIFIFLIQLVAPDLGQRTSSSDSFPTTAPETAAATQVVVPTPDPDPQVAGALPYIHSTGLFQTFRPAGADWLVSEADLQNAESVASVVFQSPERLALIHNYIRPGVEYESLESLSTDFLTEDHYAAAWSAYDNWRETDRQITPDGVVANFALESAGNNYLGRSTSRLDNGWLYVSRIVVPANNPALLELLASYTNAYFVGYRALQQLPLEWPALVDQQLGYALKHPVTWSVVAGDVGRPVTLSATTDSGQHTIRLLSEPDHVIATSDEAAAWLQARKPDATVVATAPLPDATESGFQLAYTFADSAGDEHSGFLVLLNNVAGDLFAADAELEPAGVNLVDTAAVPEDLADLQRALVEGFMALPPQATQPIPELQAAQ